MAVDAVATELQANDVFARWRALSGLTANQRRPLSGFLATGWEHRIAEAPPCLSRSVTAPAVRVQSLPRSIALTRRREVDNVSAGGESWHTSWYLFSGLDRSVLNPENHECALIDVSCFEKVEQMAADQIICEQTRNDLDKTEHAVGGPTNSEQAVICLAKFELEVNCLVVLLCALFLIPW